MKNKFEIVEKLSESNSIKILFLLMLGGIIIRLHFTQFHIPINLDGIDYFIYAVAMSKEEFFPTGYLETNFGWPSFVSVFFTLFPNSETEKEKESPHDADLSGKSVGKIYKIYLNNGIIRVACTDWAKEINNFDSLKISIHSKKHIDWINKEAY